MNQISRYLEKARKLDVRESADSAARKAIEGADRAGLVEVAWKRIDSPVGPLILANTETGLVTIAFEKGDLDDLLSRLSIRLSARVLELPARLDPVHHQLDEYFGGRRRKFALPLDWRLVGPGFSRAVLEATVKIRYGSWATYREVAAKAGNARASRAAGNALAANPIPIVIPCHRVLRSNGSVGGYGGGVERKELLLSLEGVSDLAEY